MATTRSVAANGKLPRLCVMIAIARYSGVMTVRTLTPLMFALVGPVVADEPGGMAAWKFEQLKLKNGTVLQGLIVEQTPTGVRFQNVRQKPGRPTVVFYTTFTANEIESVERLEAADREQLQARLRELVE